MVIAKSRTGKTTLAVHLFSKCQRAVFLNTQLEDFVSKAGKPLGQLSWLDNWQKMGTHVIINPPVKAEDEAILDYVIDVLLRHATTPGFAPCHVFIDELDKYATKHYISQTHRGLWKRGLKWGIIPVGITQRPQEVHNTALTQTYLWYVGHLEEGDLEYMVKERGVHARSVPKFSWTRIDFDRGEVRSL